MFSFKILQELGVLEFSPPQFNSTGFDYHLAYKVDQLDRGYILKLFVAHLM